MNEEFKSEEPCQQCTADDICPDAEKEREKLWEILSQVLGMSWDKWTFAQQKGYIDVHKRMRRHALGQAAKMTPEMRARFLAKLATRYG